MFGYPEGLQCVFSGLIHFWVIQSEKCTVGAIDHFLAGQAEKVINQPGKAGISWDKTGIDREKTVH